MMTLYTVDGSIISNCRQSSAPVHSQRCHLNPSPWNQLRHRAACPEGEHCPSRRRDSRTPAERKRSHEPKLNMRRLEQDDASRAIHLAGQRPRRRSTFAHQSSASYHPPLPISDVSEGVTGGVSSKSISTAGRTGCGRLFGSNHCSSFCSSTFLPTGLGT